MSRVKRVRVEVDIENDDGSVSHYETEGVPPIGTVNVQLNPRYSQGLGLVTAVSVEVEAVLNAIDGASIYRVRESAPKILALTEAAE
jgi:hypothetical protein